MKFCCFNPVPWPALEKRPDHWPFPNSSFDSTLATEVFDSCIDQLVYAESCGFDWVGVGEDHMTAYGIVPNPMLLLSIVAQRTERIKLAILGAPLPLLNPIRVAEECAMVDVLSKGRFIAGFIRGVPQNYAAYNMSPDESRERFAQANELIKQAWTRKDVFSWDSEHYQFPTISIWPQPLQEPHPPILYSANSEASAIFAAENKAMIGAIHLYSKNALETVGQSIRAYKKTATSNGWEPSPDQFLVGLQTCIAETDEEAINTLRPALDYQYNVLSGTYNEKKKKIAAESSYGYSPTEVSPPSIEERIENGIILCGSPETVCKQIRTLEDRLGVGTISMHLQVGNMSNEHVIRSMNLFRDCIRPVFPDSDAHKRPPTSSAQSKPKAQSLGWEVCTQRTIHDSPWYTISQDQLKLPDGEKRQYTYINHPGSVFIVPITKKNRIALIRSYRYTIDDWCWEIPAGGLGDQEGKTPEQAARTELYEEMGSHPKRLIHLGGRYLGNGTARHWGEFYIALGVIPADPTTDDQTEVITESRSVSIDEARAMAMNGTINDGDSALAVLLAISYIQDHPDILNEIE